MAYTFTLLINPGEKDHIIFINYCGLMRHLIEIPHAYYLYQTPSLQPAAIANVVARSHLAVTIVNCAKVRILAAARVYNKEGGRVSIVQCNN